MTPSLCETCKNMREVRTARSRFLLCELSVTNADFSKYPLQPVLRCDGYQLSGEDVLGCASFEDSIGVNGWPIEAHVAGDVIFKFPPIPQSRGYNELPYRMLVPAGIDNLLIAGRCASMTHEGQSAARVSGACFAMGEAVGSAAALALSGNTIPRDIAVEKLQQKLQEQGAFIGRDQKVPEGL